MPEPITVDVWSDVACPWCYIGKRNLEAGIALYVEAAGEHAPEVEVTYRSYLLAPDTPVDVEGTEIEYLARRKRVPTDRLRQMLAQVTEAAAAAGLHYDFAAVRPANTLLAHQLLHLARAHGVQADVKERLMAARFVEGLHVGDVEVLADLGSAAGLDRQEVLSALASGGHLDAVRADRAEAAELGITGVPFFVLDGLHGVSGAHPPQAFARALTRRAAERHPGTADG